MMLKLTIKDILKQKSFGGIAIVSGILLGLVYYFLTLSSAVDHNLIVLVDNYQIIYPLALIIAVIIAASSNFILNKKWTFKEKVWS